MATTTETSTINSSDPEIRTLEVEIEQARQKMADSLVDLKEQVNEAVDWHIWVKKYPLPMAAAAFVAGYIVGRHLL